MKGRKMIAVMGGTRFDTETGCELLREMGAECVASPAMGTPSEQNALQYGDPGALQRAVEARCGELAGQGVGSLLVFCNSLSVSIDADRLALCSGLRVVTPLTSLPALVGRFQRFFVLGANAKSVSGIEKILYGLRSEIRICSFSSLDLVERIEQGESAQAVWEQGLGSVVEMAVNMDMDCFVLGCTHYSALAGYVERKLAGRSDMTVADTGRMAAEILLQRIGG